MDAVATFFELLRERLTQADIRHESPGDPGHPDYVALWTKILTSGAIPKRSTFDLSEVIGLTGWGTPARHRRQIV